ncbi:MAG: hypothetical protein WC455_17755 [Dehalococcoidia bacterium]|jgi:hypothetical protein
MSLITNLMAWVKLTAQIEAMAMLAGEEKVKDFRERADKIEEELAKANIWFTLPEDLTHRGPK